VSRHPRVLIAEGTLGKALEDPIRTFEGLSGDVHCFNDFPGDQSTRILLPIRWMAGGQAFPGHSLRVQLSRHLARCFPRPRGAGGLELAPVVARASVWLALILPTSSCITIQPTGICSATKQGLQTTRSCRINQPTRTCSAINQRLQTDQPTSTCSATNQRLQTKQPELAVQPTRGCRNKNKNKPVFLEGWAVLVNRRRTRAGTRTEQIFLFFSIKLLLLLFPNETSYGEYQWSSKNNS